MAEYGRNDDPFQLLSFDPAAVAIRASRNGDILDKLAAFVKDLDHYVKLNRRSLDLTRAKVDPGGEYKEMIVPDDEDDEDDAKEHKEDDSSPLTKRQCGTDISASSPSHTMYQQQQQQQQHLAYGYGGVYPGYPPVMGMPHMYMNPAAAGPGAAPDICFACGSRLFPPPDESGAAPNSPPMPPLLNGQQQQQQQQSLGHQQPPLAPVSHQPQLPQKRPFEGMDQGHQQQQQVTIQGVTVQVPAPTPSADSSSSFYHQKLPPRSKANWTKEEDSIVIDVVTHAKTKPFTAWSELAHCIPGRSGKSIRDRWVNHLSPTLVHTPFTTADDHVLWQGYKQFGKRWVEISGKFFNSTRSENQVKNRFYSAAFKKFVTKEFGHEEYAKAFQKSDPALAATTTGKTSPSL